MNQPHPDQGTPEAKGSRRASRKAKRAERAAAANERLTASLQALHATQRATGLNATDATTGDEQLSVGKKLAVAATSVFVLGFSLAMIVVIIGLQTEYYATNDNLGSVDMLFGLFALDMPQLLPVAIEGVVWACTLMAATLALLNRESTLTTRAMWFAASIAAFVNTHHALATSDLVTALAKGGLSLAAPLVVHLFIHHFVHIIRTGKTVAQHVAEVGERWATVGRAIRTVLRTIVAHVLHPRIAFGALSTYVALRTLSYNHAWFINAAKYRAKLRQPAPTDDDPEPEPRADVVAVLGTQADDDRAVRALLAAYEAELSDIDPNLPTAGDTDPDATGSHRTGGAGANPDEPAGANPGSTPSGANPPEGPVSGLTSIEPEQPEGGTNPLNRGWHQGNTSTGTGRNPSANQGGTGQRTRQGEPVTPTAGTSPTNPVEPGDGPSDTERIVQRLWADHHAGMQTSNADLAAQLDVKPGTVKSVRFRWKQGRYPDPYTNN